MKVDYLIVGQGITGTLLSWHLMKAGKTVLVIDDENECSSSRVASGLINPVTGKRLVKSWMIDELLNTATETYREFGQEAGFELLQEYRLINIFSSAEESELFSKRATETDFLKERLNTDVTAYFEARFGAGEIKCWLVDLSLLLDSWAQRLTQNKALRNESFKIDQLRLQEGGVIYQDLKAQKIIFCDGARAFANPFFSLLPWSLNKGEMLLVSIPCLPSRHIYKYGLKIVPWKERLFWIGASYDWNFSDTLPTENFRKRTEAVLKQILKLPFTIEAHRASVRPSTVDYRPFIGFHPLYPNVGILNGLGTKGCSLAPYFAKQLADHLILQKEILPPADVHRFKKILEQRMIR